MAQLNKSSSSHETHTHGLLTYLYATAGPAHPDLFREVRFRLDGGMRQVFFPVSDVDRTAAFIMEKGRTCDTYIGVNPRTRRAGTADAVAYGCCIWLDLDTPEAFMALEEYPFPPSMVVRSGRGHHAYFILDSPHDPADIVRGNRRLAHHLGADMNCTDSARIMRPPGTFNHKDDPPRPVALECLTVETYDLDRLIDPLPDPEKSDRSKPGRALFNSDDPLLIVTPPEYVTIFTGQRIGRDNKIRCPFHGPERTPSLHVYPTTDRGWKCFGCDKGGSIYDFASHLFGIGTRGEDFVILRKRIADELLKVVA